MKVFKKVLSILIIGSLLLGISGCTPSNNNDNQATNSLSLEKEVINSEGLKLPQLKQWGS